MPSARAAATVTEITPPRDPFDFPVASKSITYRGVTYTFRELTVDENDDCRVAATDESKTPPTYDGRVHMRMMICMGSVEPKVGLEDLSKFPQRLYARVLDLVSDLNDEGTLDEESEGNA